MPPINSFLTQSDCDDFKTKKKKLEIRKAGRENGNSIGPKLTHRVGYCPFALNVRWAFCCFLVIALLDCRLDLKSLRCIDLNEVHFMLVELFVWTI